MKQQIRQSDNKTIDECIDLFVVQLENTDWATTSLSLSINNLLIKQRTTD